jgi:aspartate/methionine/tyrosine aminotransferase
MSGLQTKDRIIPPEGILPLRQAIAERVKRVNHIDVDPETEVVVTNGGQEAVFLMILTVIGPGDELIAPDPNYHVLRRAGLCRRRQSRRVELRQR